MKTLILLLFSLNTFAANHYFSSISGSDAYNGLSTGFPQLTINKLNTDNSSYLAGDSILFEKGSTFYGQILVNRSNLIFGAYGTGANPIITGFSTLSSWTNNGGGLYSINVGLASNTLMTVTINNQLQQIGRFPNTGYLTYTATSTVPSITGSALSTTTNWTGAEVVIRKQQWILDRGRVTGHSGGVVTYTNPATVNTYFGKNGYGYFFQDDIRTLDTFGEWFLNKTTKNLSVFFGANNPASYTIKASTIDTLFNCGGFNGRFTRSNITVENISFEGANEMAVIVGNGSNMVVKNCSFNNNNDAIYLFNMSGSVVTNNTVTNTLNNGINIASTASNNSTILSNLVRNCGMITGMSRSGDGMAIGIRQAGNTATIEYNRVDSAGYIGIEFQSSNIVVRYNHVSNFCMTKDDGGGIYTWSGNGVYTNRLVQNNIVINAQGAPAGTGGVLSAHGIYMDGHAMNVDIINNTVSVAQASGLFLNNGSTITARGNTFFNVPTAYNLNRMPNEPLLRGNIFTKNICYPTVSNIFYWNGELNVPTVVTIQNDMRAMFTRIDSNYYRDNISDPFDWFYHTTNGGTFIDPASQNLAAWKTTIASEAISTAIPTATADFQFNATSTPIVYNFSGLSKIALDGTVSNNSVTIPAYSSLVLLDNGAAAVAPATQIAINTGNGQTATVSNVVTAPSVIIRDASNIAVSGVSVTFAVTSGGGNATGLIAITNVSGIATVGSWTLGATAGANTLTATSAGLTGSPITFTATGTAVVVSPTPTLPKIRMLFKKIN